MEIKQLADLIENKIKLLETMRVEIKARGEAKAEAIAKYDKELAVTIMRLKNNNIEEWEGEKIVNLPATILEKVARGITWQSKLEMEKSDAMYKSVISNIDALQSELNGLQSLNRHLSQV